MEKRIMFWIKNKKRLNVIFFVEKFLNYLI